MSFAKVIKLVLVAFIIFGIIYFLGSWFLGPGVKDFSSPIINGYEYFDAGGNERLIAYGGKERSQQVIIDSRVDEYRIDGNQLLVARRPREIFMEGATPNSRLLSVCEYWTIDTKTHQVTKASQVNGLSCK
jgi:hypothetical protein